MSVGQSVKSGYFWQWPTKFRFLSDEKSQWKILVGSIKSHQITLLKTPNDPCVRCPKNGTNTFPHPLNTPLLPNWLLGNGKCPSDQDQFDVKRVQAPQWLWISSLFSRAKDKVSRHNLTTNHFFFYRLFILRLFRQFSLRILLISRSLKTQGLRVRIPPET